MNGKLNIPELNKNQLIFIGLIVVAVIAVIVVLWVNWGKLKAYIKTKQIEKTYDEQITSSELTLTTAQAQGLADKLYAAMDGPGTDEDAIYSAFNAMNSYSDLMLVMKLFGQKKSSWSLFGRESSLMEWIAADCSDTEIAKINAILASKDINFTF